MKNLEPVESDSVLNIGAETYRKHFEEHRDSYSEGFNAHQIAEALGEDPETVREDLEELDGVERAFDTLEKPPNDMYELNPKVSRDGQAVTVSYPGESATQNYLSSDIAEAVENEIRKTGNIPDNLRPKNRSTSH